MTSQGLASRVLEALEDTGWAVTNATREALVTATPSREAYLERQSGNATLRVASPLDDSLELLLTNPLDPSLPEGHDGFGGELATAHDRICSEVIRQSDPIEVIADGHVLLIVRVEEGATRDDIERYTTAIETVARETDCLHRTLRQTVSEWGRQDGES